MKVILKNYDAVDVNFVLEFPVDPETTKLFGPLEQEAWVFN